MATLTRGFSLAADELLTTGKLHRLIDESTVTAIVRADLDSSLKGVTVGAAAPGSPATGELWFDTSPGGNQGILNEFDGARFRPIAVGFLGHYSGVGTIDAGSLMKLDTTNQFADARIGVDNTTTVNDRPIGVAIKQMTGGSPTAPIVTHGKVFSIKKATGAATAIGDGLGPSATAGAAMSTTVGSWGVSLGGNVIAIALEVAASGATTVAGYVVPSQHGTAINWKQTAANLLNEVVPAALSTWSGSFGTPQWITFSAAPSGTTARLVQVRVRDVVDTDTTSSIAIAIRMEGSGLAIEVAPTLGAVTRAAGATPTADCGLHGTLWIPGQPGTNNRAEYLVESNDAAADLRVSIWERAVALGGTVGA